MQAGLIRANPSGANYSQFPLRNCEVISRLSDAFAERRGSVRSVKTFMPACIDAEGKVSVALLRDVSGHGAGFESNQEFKVGQKLKFRWGDEAFRGATVIWANGDRFGVENDTPTDEFALSTKKYRSVRIDLTAPASVFIAGERFEGDVLNFAQRGICALLDREVRQGSLATVRVGPWYFENVTARWADKNRVGFALPSALPVREMSKLLSGR